MTTKVSTGKDQTAASRGAAPVIEDDSVCKSRVTFRTLDPLGVERGGDLIRSQP